MYLGIDMLLLPSVHGGKNKGRRLKKFMKFWRKMESEPKPGRNEHYK